MFIKLFSSGSTERLFLDNCDQIVLKSLPKDKLINNYFRDDETAKLFILNQVSFCQERLKVNVDNTTFVTYEE